MHRWPNSSPSLNQLRSLSGCIRNKPKQEEREKRGAKKSSLVSLVSPALTSSQRDSEGPYSVECIDGLIRRPLSINCVHSQAASVTNPNRRNERNGEPKKVLSFLQFLLL